MEAETHSIWISEQLQERGHEVILALLCGIRYGICALLRAEGGRLSFRAHRAFPSGSQHVEPSLGAPDHEQRFGLYCPKQERPRMTSADDVTVSIIYH
jgi:hypothetical protein